MANQPFYYQHFKYFHYFCTLLSISNLEYIPHQSLNNAPIRVKQYQSVITKQQNMFTSHQPPKKRIALFRKLSKMTLFIGIGLLYVNPMNAFAQEKPKKAPIMRSVQYNLPSGYQQVGTTELFFSQRSNSIDLIGRYNARYYSSTFSDGGYKVAMQVNDNGAFSVDCLNGTTSNGVSFNASVEAQGELARVCYTVHNSNDYEVSVSLGTHADVMIGSNDRAPIEQRRDQVGNPYGLTMKDGNGAQLCVLYGAGLAGVSKVDDYWFGYYGQNNSSHQMVGNYSAGSNYMQENGSYDSGMGWCWKNRTIPAGETVVFSYLIGVGEVNLEPNSSFEVTPDDPEGWNDLSRPHRLTLNGTYESPAGINGFIEYSVEDSETWSVLTDTLASGEEFTASLVAMFKPEREAHTINFRTVDAVGNTTLLTPIIYKDVYYHEVSGIESKTYNYGDSIFQTNLASDLDESQYVVNDYRNNVNAGTATFKVQGVFPMTIGSRTYSFEISPMPLEGDIEFTNSISYIYSGDPFTPEWQFTHDRQNELISNQDYQVDWKDNVYPGVATLQVRGVNNFCGTLQNSFVIDKAQIRDDLYSLQLPSKDITFDNASHPASYTKAEGVGDITFYYSPSSLEELSTVAPINIGKYDVYAEIADGSLYYGTPTEKLGSFTIYQFDESDWATIETIVPMLTQKGWQNPWNLSGGISSASSFDGLTIEEGHVVGIDLSNAGLSGSFPIELVSFNNIESINISNNNFDGALESILAFASQNPLKFAKIQELNISGNSFSGNVGAFAAAFPSLRVLSASSNHISDVFPTIASTVTNLSLENQIIDRIVEIDLSNISVEALVQQIPTVLLYNHQGQAYNKPLRLKCTASDGWNVILTYSNGHIAFSDVSEQNAYYGNSGDVLDVVALASDGYSSEAYLSIKLDFSQGDANFDGEISVLDLQSTILFAFDDYSNPFNFTAADTYKDNSVNVQDVVCTANILISQNSTDFRKNVMKAPAISRNMDESYVYIEDNKLYLNSSYPVAAIDILIDGDTEWCIGQYGLNNTSTGNHLIGYSLSGINLPTGTIQLGEVANGSRILNCVLSDERAQSIGVYIRDVTSGIDAIESKSSDSQIIYDLNGRRLNSQSKGINIIIDSNGVRKIINRK